MSDDSKRLMRSEWAGRAVELAKLMDGTSPVLFLRDRDGRRETPDQSPLSGEAARVAVLGMTFCNPLVLHAASIIEGTQT